MRGYTEAQLRSYLLSQGWPASEIDNSMDVAKDPQKAASAVSSLKIKYIFTAIIVLLVVAGTVFAASHLFAGPKCGNEACEAEETIDTCCADCGCRGEQTCEENACVEPVCGECEYVYSHECIAYECCDDSECNTDEECISNKCGPILCEECEHAVDHTCTAITRCDSGDDCCPGTCDHSSDTDCEEAGYGPIDADYTDTDETADHECIDGIECDDLDDCTIDECTGGNCSYTNVTECINDDFCCPKACDFSVDSDCEENEGLDDLVGKNEDCERDVTSESSYEFYFDPGKYYDVESGQYLDYVYDTEYLSGDATGIIIQSEDYSVVGFATVTMIPCNILNQALEISEEGERDKFIVLEIADYQIELIKNYLSSDYNVNAVQNVGTQLISYQFRTAFERKLLITLTNSVKNDRFRNDLIKVIGSDGNEISGLQDTGNYGSSNQFMVGQRCNLEGSSQVFCATSIISKTDYDNPDVVSINFWGSGYKSPRNT